MWCIQFFHSGHWDTLEGSQQSNKTDCIEVTNYLNKSMEHSLRMSMYQGHRYRVRKV